MICAELLTRLSQKKVSRNRSSSILYCIDSCTFEMSLYFHCPMNLALETAPRSAQSVTLHYCLARVYATRLLQYLELARDINMV